MNVSLSVVVFQMLEMRVKQFWWNLLVSDIFHWKPILVLFFDSYFKSFRKGPIWGRKNMENPVSEGVGLDQHKNEQIKPFD